MEATCKLVSQTFIFMVFNIVLLIVAYKKTYFNYHEPWEKLYLLTSILNLMMCGCIFVGVVRKQLGLLALFVDLGGPIAFVSNLNHYLNLQICLSVHNAYWHLSLDLWKIICLLPHFLENDHFT